VFQPLVTGVSLVFLQQVESLEFLFLFEVLEFGNLKKP